MKKYNSSIILVIGLILGIGIGAFIMFYAMPAAVNKETGSATKETKVLFYRNPMNPSATSPTPMKDDMGMDYVPVYEGENEAAAGEEAPGTVRISTEKIQKTGVRSEVVKRRSLRRVIRTVGRVDPDETKVFNINAKVGGWVERLYLNRTDQMVEHHEPLLELYSPELVSAQEEYLLAFREREKVKGSPYPEVRSSTESILSAGRQRLKYWDISDDQIKRLEEEGKITRTMTIRAPAHGGVTEKMVVEGQRIEAGESLFKIIDHTSVWVYGELYEYELPFVRIGQMAKITPSYSPGDVYMAAVEHIYTHLGAITYTPEGSEEIRTAKIRFELRNPVHKLKLGMYVNVELEVETASNAVAVPDSALIDTGVRQVVIVDKGDGRFEPRDVKVGATGEGYYEILKGVTAGEVVVTSANFLIDSESNLKTALGGMGVHNH